MGYPDEAAELMMLQNRESTSPLDRVEPVISTLELLRMIQAVRLVHVSSAVERYAVAIAQATRSERDLRVGASPRATLHLVRAAKARAAMEGRDFVLPDDIDALAVRVLAHRLIPANRFTSNASEATATVVEGIVQRIVADTVVPVGAFDRV